MTPAAEPRHSPEEVARLGLDIYERRVRPLLTPADDGKLVAIDTGTGEYECDADDYQAVTRLRGRLPAAEIWLVRVGSPTVYVLRSPR